MARKLVSDTTFDDHEDEVIFTRSAVKADPDAADLLTRTDAWMARVEVGRAADRAARVAEGEAGAARIIANGRLDDTGRALGRQLGVAVNGDRQSARWTRIFGGPVGDFIAQALATQIAAMRAWLTISGDTVIDEFRPELERWTAAGDAAITATASGAQVRGAALVGREQLGEDMTRERDGLQAALTARAAERNLPRDWPARFFRVARRQRNEPHEPVDPAS